MVDSGPIAIEELVNNERVIAIVNVFYPVKWEEKAW